MVHGALPSLAGRQGLSARRRGEEGSFEAVGLQRLVAGLGSLCRRHDLRICCVCVCMHDDCVSCTGAAAINQMDYKAALKHKAVVAEVACGAAATGQWSMLGVLFDEVSRQAVSKHMAGSSQLV